MSSSSISVVIIFLDGEAFIEEAIESVRLQTHRDWELLLVDDGSSDRSAPISRRAAEADPERIRYLQHPDGRNHGTSASRNLGAASARGEYLIFLDCDDILLPDNLSRHAQMLDADPDLAAAFSPTMFWIWDEAYAQEPDSVQSSAGFANRRIEAPEMLLAMLQDESVHPANCGTLFRRARVADCGAFEESFRGMYEDTALLTKLLMKYPTYMIGECLSAYRVHRSSQCHKAAEEGQYDPNGPSESRRAFLEWAWSYASGHASDSRVRRTIDKELAAYCRHAPSSAQTLWRSLAKRARRKAVKLWARSPPPQDTVTPVLTTMARMHDTYIAMHRPHEAAALTARMAALRQLGGGLVDRSGAVP